MHDVEGEFKESLKHVLVINKVVNHLWSCCFENELHNYKALNQCTFEVGEIIFIGA